MFSADQTDELWSRRRRGEPSRLIARSLGCHATKVRRLLAASGGVRPPARRRRERHLSGSELEEMSRGITPAWTARTIAPGLAWPGLAWAGLGWPGLGRSASTVSREIARNGGRGTTEPRRPTWRPGTGPVDRRRPGSPQIRAPRPGPGQAGRRLVPAADRGLAAPHAPGRREYAGVPRDDASVYVKRQLPVSLRSWKTIHMYSA
jgi:hypothetical protein